MAVTRSFEVVIERRIIRRVRVMARSAALARSEITDYGVAEAWSDYDCAQETDTVRIVSSKAVGGCV